MILRDRNFMPRLDEVTSRSLIKHDCVETTMLIISELCMAAIISSEETQVKIMKYNKKVVCFIEEFFRGETFFQSR